MRTTRCWWIARAGRSGAIFLEATTTDDRFAPMQEEAGLANESGFLLFALQA